MKIYRKNTGEKYTPFSHFNMKTQVIFNPEGGCSKANVTLTILPKGSGSHDEVREGSDQIFLMLKGTMKVSANGELKAELNEGDAILVYGGETHSVINEKDEACIFYAITVPSLDKTH